MQLPIAFFLGANTPRGFLSLFPCLAEEPGLRLSPLKTGPGCGKSTFLRSVADWEEPRRTELFYCSSDPSSLDGVLLHSRNLAVLDGTAPHLYDPPLPGAQGEYLLFPPFLDAAGLAAKRQAAETLKAKGAACYAQAYRLLEAAAPVRRRMRAMLESEMPLAQLLRRAKGIAGRELPSSAATGRPGVLRQRFLDALTPDGMVFLSDTVLALSTRIYRLEDRFGLGTCMLELWKERALALGLEVYACCDPQEPERLLHLLLPEQKLAFITEDGSRMPDLHPYRSIRVEAYLPEGVFAAHRGKLRLLRHLREALFEDAVTELQQARELHRELEQLYRPHLDIPALMQLQQAFYTKEHQSKN